MRSRQTTSRLRSTSGKTRNSHHGKLLSLPAPKRKQTSKSKPTPPVVVKSRGRPAKNKSPISNEKEEESVEPEAKRIKLTKGNNNNKELGKKSRNDESISSKENSSSAINVKKSKSKVTKDQSSKKDKETLKEPASKSICNGDTGSISNKNKIQDKSSSEKSKSSVNNSEETNTSNDATPTAEEQTKTIELENDSTTIIFLDNFNVSRDMSVPHPADVEDSNASQSLTCDDGNEILDANGSGIFQCADCGYTSENSSDVVMHDCPGRREYECSRCKTTFPTEEELISHATVHDGFTCDFCKKKFRSKAKLKNHMKGHIYSELSLDPASEETSQIVNTVVNDDNESCDSNGDAFSQSDDLKKEDSENSTKVKKSKDYFPDGKPVDNSDQYMKISGEGFQKRFTCKICDKVSGSKADLKKHIRTHTGERPFKCETCGATFVQITALRFHQTRHTGKKPFICDICNKMFAIKDRLRLHMRLHTGEKPNKCEKCNKSFARRSQLTAHMKRHEENKPTYECEDCGQLFSSYHTMKGHANAHKGIKEFQCGACGKKFIRVEGMYKHIRTVHHGSRPYTCTVCGKAFKGHLQQHMRLHSGLRPYECPTCHSSFTQNSQLTVHMRIHTGERPYKCQVCGSSFAHSSACKIHMRSHTGEKPFKCVLCETTFSQLPHLKKHMKCVHNASKPYLCTLCTENQTFFQTQRELDIHKKIEHHLFKTPEQEAEELVEEASLTRLRNRLAVLLYRISSDERRSKFGFGSHLIDDVLKKSLMSSGHTPVIDPALSRLTELRHNAHLLLKWTIPKETMEEYHRNNMTVDEVIDMLTS